MKKLLIFFIILIQVGYAYSQQEDYYTIYSVNDSKTDSIEVGKEKKKKGYGDIIFESDDKIHWTNKEQRIEVSYTGDGRTYTFLASSYFNKKDKNRVKYSYLKYLRTVTLATKGQENAILQELPIFLVHNIAMIDEFRHPIDEQHNYYLVYLDDENKIKKIKAKRHKKSQAFFFTKEQLQDNGILHNKKIKQLRYISAGNEITVVSDLSIIIIK